MYSYLPHEKLLVLTLLREQLNRLVEYDTILGKQVKYITSQKAIDRCGLLKDF